MTPEKVLELLNEAWGFSPAYDNLVKLAVVLQCELASARSEAVEECAKFVEQYKAEHGPYDKPRDLHRCGHPKFIAEELRRRFHQEPPHA